MSDPHLHGGAVTANAEEVLTLARAVFREDCALLVSILQARDNISANTYLNEDSHGMAKRYEAVEKELGLNMLRKAGIVALRLRDPAVVPQDGGDFAFLV